MSEPLWTVEAMAAAMGAERAGALPRCDAGISIDSRSIEPGEAVLRHQGRQPRRARFRRRRRCKAGAALAVVAAGSARALPTDAPLLVVPDVLEGLRDLARAARARTRRPRSSRVTGSVGKTATKEALRLALGARAARRMPRSRPSTITGACRCRWRAAARARATPCSRSA